MCFLRDEVNFLSMCLVVRTLCRAEKEQDGCSNYIACRKMPNLTYSSLCWAAGQSVGAATQSEEKLRESDDGVAQHTATVNVASPNFSAARYSPPVKIRFAAFSRPPFVSPVAVSMTPSEVWTVKSQFTFLRGLSVGRQIQLIFIMDI